MRLSRRLLTSIGVMTFGLLLACGEPPAPVAKEGPVSPRVDAGSDLSTGGLPSADDIHASYVLLASSKSSDRVAYARIIMDDGFSCPAVAATCGSEPSKKMVARDKPRFSNVEHCPSGGCFPVTVCEASVSFDQNSQVCLAGGETINLPVPKAKPAEILVMGDTGCKDPNNNGGDCLDEASGKSSDLAEPFASLVSAAGTSFDLILHMGDYNYRGTPGSVPWVSTSGGDTTHHTYDAGDGASTCEQASTDSFRTQASSRSKLPDQWDIWRKDFFEPAQPLLAAGPWVFARGNHELCSRAGAGWLYFLDAGFKPDGTQIDCPSLDGVDHPTDPFDYSVVAPMYTVELDSLNLVVLDSANACDDGVPSAPNGFVTAYENQFAGRSVPASGTTWIMSHRPFWTNATLQATSSSGPGLDGIALSLAGHKHLFESYTPTGTGKTLPAEVVAGNGGVSLSGDFDSCTQQTVDGTSVWVAGAEGYGFLHVKFDGATGSWSGELRDAANTLTASCDGSGSPSLCKAQGAACG
jgi:hypothetical protein